MVAKDPTFFRRTAKILIRQGGCPGWSESSLGAQSFCWLCHVAAHLASDLMTLIHVTKGMLSPPLSDVTRERPERYSQAKGKCAYQGISLTSWAPPGEDSDPNPHFEQYGDNVIYARRIYVWPSFSNTCACGTFRPFPFVHIVFRRVRLYC